MLKELFLVAESGTIVFYKNYFDENINEFRDPALISAFITAIQGFSNETFNSSFKKMELDDQTLFVLFDKIYFIGIFSYDELEASSFRLLKKIAKEFNNNYTQSEYDGILLDLTNEVGEIIKNSSINKFKKENIVIAFLLMTFVTFLYFPILNHASNFNSGFYRWIGLLLLTSIINSYLVPQRWIALISCSFITAIPSFYLLFVIHTRQSFFFADYTAAMTILPWLLGSYIIERRYIHIGIIPKIPFVSNLF